MYLSRLLVNNRKYIPFAFQVTVALATITPPLSYTDSIDYRLAVTRNSLSIEMACFLFIFSMKWHIFIMAVLMVCSHSLLARNDKVDMRVILLGTSGPEMSPDRSGYATLIEVGGKNYCLMRVVACCNGFTNRK